LTHNFAFSLPLLAWGAGSLEILGLSISAGKFFSILAAAIFGKLYNKIALYFSRSSDSSRGSGSAILPGGFTPNPEDPDDEEEPLSVNQAQQKVERGQAPRTIDRVDRKQIGNGNHQDHIHFKRGGALNRNGEWKHKLRGARLSNIEKAFIRRIGFKLPRV
jgi:hypothetical protein